MVVRRDLDSVLQAACRVLGDDEEILIRIEHHAGDVTIEVDGERVDFPQRHLGEVGLVGLVEDALAHLGRSEPDEYYILDLDACRGDPLVWWGVSKSGYTTDLSRASRYSAVEVATSRSLLDNGHKTRAIPCREAERRAVRVVPGDYAAVVGLGADWPAVGPIAWPGRKAADSRGGKREPT